MTQFWLATILFLFLGLTPLAVATVLNLRDRRFAAGTSGKRGAR